MEYDRRNYCEMETYHGAMEAINLVHVALLDARNVCWDAVEWKGS